MEERNLTKWWGASGHEKIVRRLGGRGHGWNWAVSPKILSMLWCSVNRCGKFKWREVVKWTLKTHGHGIGRGSVEDLGFFTFRQFPAGWSHKEFFELSVGRRVFLRRVGSVHAGTNR